MFHVKQANVSETSLQLLKGSFFLSILNAFMQPSERITADALIFTAQSAGKFFYRENPLKQNSVQIPEFTR